tara:strand:- start:4 stop:555 length:552 start_codon:yes stop_codon:yes gene_type:complete
MTIVNCTGLPATFSFETEQKHMRLQPIDTAHVDAIVDTNASSIGEWISEWINLISYGPTYNKLVWKVPPQGTETVRFQVEEPLSMEIDWSDPSVSWEHKSKGKWSIDIQKAVDLTLFLRSDIGEYTKQRNRGGPASVKSVHLKPYLEIACDDEIPFKIDKKPISIMFWSPQIDIKQIVNPEMD